MPLLKSLSLMRGDNTNFRNKKGLFIHSLSNWLALPARLFVPNLAQDGISHDSVAAVVQVASESVRWVIVVPVLCPQLREHDLLQPSPVMVRCLHL